MIATFSSHHTISDNLPQGGFFVAFPVLPLHRREGDLHSHGRCGEPKGLVLRM